MMTSIQLPDEVVQALHLRASQEGRDVQAVIADLLKTSSAVVPHIPVETTPIVAKDLPVIKVRPIQTPIVTPQSTQEWCDWLKEVDLQLEVERYEKALGHQHVDRADG